MDKMTEVCELTHGYHLYRKVNGVGGYAYYSDEAGDGVLVWDTCLVAQGTLLAALADEDKTRGRE